MLHNRAQSFVLRSYTMHELRNGKSLCWLVLQSAVNRLCSVHGQGQELKRKQTTENLVCQVS